MSSNDNTNIDGLPILEDIPVEAIAQDYPSVIVSLRDLDPTATATVFAGLLVLPQLQSNCIRLEALVHLAIAYSTGELPPTEPAVRDSFDALDRGYCGSMEDPAEDVFAVLVSTPDGNFRVFQGIRQCPGFYVQRILEVIETMPDIGPFKKVTRSTEALLRLSEAVAARAGVSENMLGNETPVANLPADLSPELSRVSNLVCFTERELADMKISAESLADFVFDPADYARLRTQVMGNSDLERRPIVILNGSYCLVLPTAVSSAITRLVIETISAMGKGELFESVLAAGYGRFFYQSSVLGQRWAEPPVFEKINAGGIASVITEIDPGCFLHVVFFLDGLDNFLQDGFGGMNADPEALSEALNLEIARASSQVRTESGFQGGLTLLVHCGYGRNFLLSVEGELPEQWRLEFVGAPDLNTLNWLHEFNALSLWRLLDAREVVKRQGTLLFNVSGLVNLVAWSRQLKGHLVPHGQIPAGFGDSGSPSIVVVDQNALRKLRHDVLVQWNPRRVLDSSGRWVKVLKIDLSAFEDDRNSPFYASQDDIHEHKLRGVYVAPLRSWWIEIIYPDLTSKDSVFQHWTMLCVWLRRAAPILDGAYVSLPHMPLSFRVSFEEIVRSVNANVTPKTSAELGSLLTVSTESGSNEINIRVGKGFHAGFFQPENVGERALVEAFVVGVSTLSGEGGDTDKIDALVRRICPTSEARQIHMFQARSFRDYVEAEIGNSPTLIDPLDDAAFRIGLGWKARSRDRDPDIVGIKECTSYLNSVVRVILDELCALLQQLDRSLFVINVIQNHESAAHERDVWKRTTRAVLALHDNNESTLRGIVEHQGRLNVCFTASRILLEAAICECPLLGGRIPGELDLSRAMARAMLAYSYGGWSDAIYWGAIEPNVRVTPLGDVHIQHGFMDTVYEPFGRAVGEVTVQDDAASYSKLYSPTEVLSTTSGLFEQAYSDAWRAEFKVSIDGLLAFAHTLGDVENKSVEAIRKLRRSLLIDLFAESAKVPLTDAAACLDLLTLHPRPRWRAVEGDFVDKDWFPWRFRRRLSVLRRPFVAIDPEADPIIAVAPGLLADAFYALIRNFHRGEVPEWQIRSSEMLRWIGRANHLQRTAFNQKVAERMRALGWEAEAEVKVTNILGRSLERNYGDVDVLAWRRSSGKVLAMECKDLQFNKTLGEVAEQLSDFRGVMNSDGKRDPLKRHLDRVEILAAHKSEISKVLRLAESFQIEGYLVFKNPVPMRFAWERMASTIKLALFSELDKV